MGLLAGRVQTRQKPATGTSGAGLTEGIPVGRRGQARPASGTISLRVRPARHGSGDGRMERAERARAIMDRLAELYPDAHIMLNYDTPYHLLIAVILSAQTTDVGVNKVTPVLFERFPEPEDLAGAPIRPRSRRSSGPRASSATRRSHHGRGPHDRGRVRRARCPTRWRGSSACPESPARPPTS
jgi:hypothetical protein